MPTVIGKTTAVDPAELHTYHRNARRGDIPTIVASLRRHGQYKPITVNLGTHTGRPNEVLAGNHTLLAFRDLAQSDPFERRWRKILVHWIDVDNDEAERINVLDNKTGSLGGYDDAELLRQVESFGDDLDGTGFVADDIDELRALVAQADAVTPPEDTPAGPGFSPGVDVDAVVSVAETVTRPGDVWQLGRHTVACIDCTNVEAVKALAGDCDLILTDPPYCSGGFQESGKSAGSVGTDAAHKQIANDRLSTRGYVALMKAALSTIDAVAAYIFTDWRMWSHLFDVVEASRFGVRSMIVWDKGSMGMGRGWRTQHELIMWAARETPEYPPRYGGRGNVIQSQRTGNKLHTTQKPVDLIAALLANTPSARKVFDPFGGSGTTLMACETAGLECVTTELDAAYVDTICARYQLATGTVPVRVGDGAAVDFAALAQRRVPDQVEDIVPADPGPIE